MRAAVLVVCLLGCRENKKTPVVAADPAPSVKVPSASSVFSLTIDGANAPAAIDGAGAFEIMGSVASVVLVTNCPGAPSGCGVRPDVLAGKNADLASFGCPGGRLVAIGLKSPWSKLKPATFHRASAITPDISVTFYRDKQLTISNDWVDKPEENVLVLEEISADIVRGRVHGKLGDVTVDGPFRAPRCATP